MNFKEDIRKHFNVLLTNEQENLFNLYYEELIDYNKHTNLTAITEKDEVFYKHFYDSLTLIPFINNKEGSLCDMGSGAGFPSLPLKIVFPYLKITIVDSANKRIKFLKDLVNKLNLENVTIVKDRVEEFGVNNQKSFDYVTARALGNLTLITEMALPMLKVDGSFLAMKGSKVLEEINDANNAINLTGGKIVNQMNLELPYNYGFRSIVSIKKVKHVQGFPRRYPEMLKKPL